MAAAAQRLSDAELDALVRASAEEGSWDALLPLLPLLDEPTRARFAALPAVHDPTIQPALREAAREHGVEEDVDAALGAGR